MISFLSFIYIYIYIYTHTHTHTHMYHICSESSTFSYVHVPCYQRHVRVVNRQDRSHNKNCGACVCVWVCVGGLLCVWGCVCLWMGVCVCRTLLSAEQSAACVTGP